MKSIKKLPSTMDIKSFYIFINTNKVGKSFTRIVPRANKITRIKLVTKDEYDSLVKKIPTYKMNDHTYVFGKEIGSLDAKTNVGILLSATGDDSSNLASIKKEVSYDSIKMFHNVYGKGTSRGRCKHVAFATYRGTKNTKRSQPLPYQNEDNIQDHQYYSSIEQTDALLQPLAEELIDILGQKAEDFGTSQHSQLYNMIQKSCDKAILTCGSPNVYHKRTSTQIPPKTVKNNSSNWLGFCCTDHVDKCDSVSNKSLKEIFKKDCKTEYTMTLNDRVGPGLPTSCQYFHVWKDEHIRNLHSVHTYFMYNGLGIAQRIYDGCSITFLGFAFSHCTSFCYIMNLITGMYIFKNSPDIFSILGWGRSGGGKEYHRYKSK